MIIHLEKRLEVFGNEELNCDLGLREGWAGELEGKKLKLSNRVSGWKFFYPHRGDNTAFDDMNIDYCQNLSPVAHCPLFIYYDDYIYGMPAFIPFVPIK